MIGQEPRIEEIQAKRIFGKHLPMTLQNDRTPELWRSFMPVRKQIINGVGNDLLCVQIFDHTHDFTKFNQDALFEKWAAVEVSEFSGLPDGMEQLVIESGSYAVLTIWEDKADFSCMFQTVASTDSEYNSVDHEDHILKCR